MVSVLAYPPPLEAREAISIDGGATADVETPVLIVGGGPVGMLQALILARIHKQRCTLIERELTTTPYPKMEYTNGRSMEIYRALGLHDELRKIGATVVSEEHSNDETIVTSLVEGGRLLHVWKRDGPIGQREKSRKENDGSQYLEPHMRCHQIILEKWLKDKVKSEPLIDSHWGTAFAGLREESDYVLTKVQRATGESLLIKSQYVIGTDGGGSWVRKSAQLESKREFLNLTVVFVHFRSASLRSIMPFPRAWHANVVGGGILVSQNEDDLWTCHFMVPPGVDPASLSDKEVLGLALGGCQGAVAVPIDEVFCRGVWKVDVAIANRFQSEGGRILLAGDACHQLSPLGGHGLNSGLGDVFDLGWKLSGVLQNWASDRILAAYDHERRQVAFENLDHVQEALTTIVLPAFAAQLKYGADVLNSDSAGGQTAREEVTEICKKGEWLHDQNGNILGVSYKKSPIILEPQEGGERPESTNSHYVPTTWPGCRAPHVFLTDGSSILDAFSPSHFNIVDFSAKGILSAPFMKAAQGIGLPLKVITVPVASEAHTRSIYERDLILIRPDGYVAWRCLVDATEPCSLEEATEILRLVSGHTN